MLVSGTLSLPWSPLLSRPPEVQITAPGKDAGGGTTGAANPA
jgi:hypothetical protein